MDMVDSRRVRIVKEGKPGTGPVVYVMAREQRVRDNWALLYAAEEAERRSVPLLVAFVIGESFLSYSERHNVWLIESLKEVYAKLTALRIPFLVTHGVWDIRVAEIVREYDAALLVLDQNPLKPVRSWRTRAAERVSVPVYEVDAHNIIPVWCASEKEEFAAYTFRPKVRKHYRTFSGEIPALTARASVEINVAEPDWHALARVRTVTQNAPMPAWITPGEDAGIAMLHAFIEERLPQYEAERNDPTKHVQSDLSPYIRWGNISAQRIAHEIEQVTGISGESKRAFLEELIVRRELAENYVYYNAEHGTVDGAHAWAKATIEAHRNDPREYVYSYAELESRKTHDALWNAAQMEMVKRGKMHGYMRMYWAKKILEWTRTPEEAIEWALLLNDTYELDGRDPNGVVGVMWSIAGVHDRAWFERPIFGKIRYMNENGCRRKFDVDAYIAYVATL